MSKDIEILADEFNDFVNENEGCTDETLTHTTYTGGRYSFVGKNYELFMKKYVELYAAAKKEEYDLNLHWIEKPSKHGVTFFFIDIDYDQKGSKRQYTKEHIEKIIDCANKFIKEHFTVYTHQLTTFITEKAKATKRDTKTKKDTYKDGFHVYYPFLPMEESHRFFVMHHLIKKMVKGELLKGVEFTSNASDIFDTSIIRSNGITMIGSKKIGGQPYDLTRIYNHKLNSSDIDDYNDDVEDLLCTLSNQKYDKSSSIKPLDDSVDDIDEIYEKYGRGRKKKVDNKKSKNESKNDSKNDSKKKKKKKNKNDSDDSDSDDDSKDSDSDDESDNSEEEEEYRKLREKRKRKEDEQMYNNEKEVTKIREKQNITIRKSVATQRDIDLAIELSRLFNEERADNYLTWSRVGYALASVSSTLYDTFVKFSKKSDKFTKKKRGKKDVTCEDVWKAADKVKQYYSLNTLRYWARDDDPAGYSAIIRRLYDPVFAKAESSKHVDIAQVVYELYKDRFVCIDIKNKKWYEFQDHRWIFIESAYTLEELISNEVRGMLLDYYKDKFNNDTHEMNDEDGMPNYEVNLKKYYKLMKSVENLGDVKFRENVVRACANKFYDTKFQEKLDTDAYLIGFTNGVYDLREKCFREGLPSDYISKTVGYDWEEFDDEEEVIEKINKFFSEIQVDEDMQEYVFMFLASCLRGIPDTKLHMWTGDGGNGKSATIDLMRNILGDYFGVVPVTLLTRKRGSSGGASPELADKYGKRVIMFQEPEYNDVLYVGTMKEQSGRDLVMARPLYGVPFYFIPQYKLILTCNVLPTIPSDNNGSDNGIWRRIRVTPFESKFVDDNPTGPREFLKNEELQEEFGTWAQPMMWLLISKYWPKYEEGVNGKKYKFSEPDKVKLRTNDYKVNSDFYAEFMIDSIEVTKKDKDSVMIATVYDAFRHWYVSSYTEKPPVKKNFVKFLTASGLKVDKQKILGIKFLMAELS